VGVQDGACDAAQAQSPDAGAAPRKELTAEGIRPSSRCTARLEWPRGKGGAATSRAITHNSQCVVPPQATAEHASVTKRDDEVGAYASATSIRDPELCTCHRNQCNGGCDLYT